MAKSFPFSADDGVKITPMQREFIEEYIANRGNGTQALLTVWKRRGKKMKTYGATAVQASELLKNPKVACVLRKRQQELLEEFKKRTIQQLYDLEEVKERCLTVKPVMVFDPEEKKMIQKMERIKGEDGKEREVGVYEFDSRGAIMAIAEQNKMLGLYPKEEKGSTNIAIVLNTSSETEEVIKAITVNEKENGE
jgi:phage terminase small subunit